jgi:anthranilate phosphoribosyltransferase
MSLLPHLERVAAGGSLTCEDARSAMRTILGGTATPVQIGGFLVALAIKGETAEELVGFARAIRETAVRVSVGLGDVPLVDTCGTGGDCTGTFNISTIVAFVVAGAGVRVAKHGNRSISSRCGSADLMEAMGVEIAMDPEDVARSIREIGIGFLFAPVVHAAMRHAQPVRRELHMRTVFNLLGPLTNPAGANAQVAGAPSEHAAGLIAGALAGLGLRRGFVVHGSDGLDEITTTGPTVAFEIRDGRVERRTLEPSDFGLPTARPQDILGGDVGCNLEIAHAVLAGERGPRRDIVIANAAATLVAADMCVTLLEGAALAAVSLDSGAARRKAESLAAFRSATL